MDILSFEFMALLAIVITGTVQTAKHSSRVHGSVAPYLSVIVGVVLSYLWFLVSGDLHNKDAHWNIDWQNMYRAFANGIGASTSATIAYQAQKAVPIPNLLPTATEIDESKLKEQVAKQKQIVAAVAEGLDPRTAKETVGLETSDPPPQPVLEEIKPTLPPPDEEIIG